MKPPRESFDVVVIGGGCAERMVELRLHAEVAAGWRIRISGHDRPRAGER